MLNKVFNQRGFKAEVCQHDLSLSLSLFLRLLFFVFLIQPERSFAENIVYNGSADTTRPVVIDYYFEPGCEDCRRVDSIVLPALEAGYAGFYELNRLNIGVETNYLRLLDVLDRLGSGKNEYVFMVLDGRVLLEGYSEIAGRLFDVMGELLICPTREFDFPDFDSSISVDDADFILAERARRFTLIGVIAAGLIDGINPCAISTLVFFISLLSVSRVRGRRLLFAGAAFCLASFLTYFIIGFGLLRLLDIFWLFSTLRLLLHFTMILALLVLAFVSFRDAMRYRKRRDPSAISLQLSDKWKKRIHGIMRAQMSSHRIVVAGFSIGVGVTIIESVCTGQVYVPTLVFIVKSGAAPTLGLMYLLLYNVLFILPLVVVFIITYQGLKFQKLLDWSKGNLVLSKILLSAFFLVMAGLMLIL